MLQAVTFALQARTLAKLVLRAALIALWVHFRTSSVSQNAMNVLLDTTTILSARPLACRVLPALFTLELERYRAINVLWDRIWTQQVQVLVIFVFRERLATKLARQTPLAYLVRLDISSTVSADRVATHVLKATMLQTLIQQPVSSVPLDTLLIALRKPRVHLAQWVTSWIHKVPHSATSAALEHMGQSKAHLHALNAPQVHTLRNQQQSRAMNVLLEPTLPERVPPLAIIAILASFIKELDQWAVMNAQLAATR